MSRAWILWSVALLLVGCGARTGVGDPDAAADVGPADAGFDAPIRDAGVDVGPRDAGRPDVRDAGPPPGDITGTWVGPLTLGEHERRFTFQLHRRADGDVMGYVLGGTRHRTLLEGSVSGREVRLLFELQDPGITRTIVVRGAVEGDLFVGTSEDEFTDVGPQPIEWRREERPVQERRWVLFSGPPSAPSQLIDVAAVVGPEGSFISGGYVARSGCTPISCGGGLLGYDEVLTDAPGTSVTLHIESTGLCGRRAVSLRGVVGAEVPTYEGRYIESDCDGEERSRPMGAFEGPRGRSDDLAAMMAALADLGDRLEAGERLVPPVPISPRYLHDGLRRRDLLVRMNEELAPGGSLELRFTRLRRLVSVEGPALHPEVADPLGVGFFDRRTRDGSEYWAEPDDGRLGAFAREGGRWRVYGNQQP